MIVLLSCSITTYTQTNTSSTGGVDSVLVAYDDLRLANVKMMQLEYERSKVRMYKNIVHNDSVIIKNLNAAHSNCESKIKTAKKARNYSLICNGVLVLLILLAL